jgi:Zn-dependent protease
MFLGEPPASQADLHFRVLGFPVRVHPFFWVVALFMGLGGGKADPLGTVVWVGVVFVSILVHEMGHASVERYYGGHPWITLYGFGGLASCNDGPRTPWRRIFVLLAGPGAGFLLAALVIAAMRLTGHALGFAKSMDSIDLEQLGLEVVTVQPMGPFVAYFQPLNAPAMNHLVGNLLQVNILWGFVNLLPVFPLDGGQIARELFNWRNPRFGTVSALQLSAGTAVLVAAYALLNERFYLGLMFGFLAYGNFQLIQFNQNRWR